ncbi:transmembrane protein 87B-like, partial [Rosa chinensis]|uniref:transmembrane protein 87B-like n=1 Tax=Rosa chinensis TaxID=74649 RepID=UPI001AD90850
CLISNRFENITFWRSEAAVDKKHSNGLIQVIIFEAADRNNIGGSAYGGQRSICCTPDLAKMEGCKQGEVIRRPCATDVNWPIVINVHFRRNSLSKSMDYKEILITKTGMYNLFFVACDPKLKEIVMSGKTVWKSPDGYLPGRMAPLMKFYVYMALAYVLIGVIWLTQYVRFWKDILQLQHCITAVIALGLFEMILWYSDYVNFNNTGMRQVFLTTLVVTVGAVRKTVSRLLILTVSMGYGVVRPTLGDLTSKVLLLGITFFLATGLLNITEFVGTINDTKRSSVKLEMYRKFSNALAVTVIASVAWIAYEVYFKATDPFNEKWSSGIVLGSSLLSGIFLHLHC